MRKRGSIGGKLEKAFKGLSVVVAGLLIMPTHILLLAPVPTVHAEEDSTIVVEEPVAPVEETVTEESSEDESEDTSSETSDSQNESDEESDETSESTEDESEDEEVVEEENDNQGEEIQDEEDEIETAEESRFSSEESLIILQDSYNDGHDDCDKYEESIVNDSWDDDCYDEDDTPDYAPYCGDGIKNQEWEQCDVGNASSQECSAQCQMNIDQCSDLTLAKITVDDFVNKPKHIGDASEDIYIGQGTNPIPSGTWFLLYWNGAFVNDPDIAGYEDVPGLAVERTYGVLRTVLHGSRGATEKEHVRGTVMFYNADVTSIGSDNENGAGSSNKLENWSDTLKEINPAQDELSEADSIVAFWLTTTTQDDGFLVDYDLIISECVDCSNYSYDEFVSCFGKPADTDLCKKYDFNDDGIVGAPDYPGFTKIQELCSEELDCSLYSYDEFLSCFSKSAETNNCKKYDFNDDGIIGGPDYPGFVNIQNECSEEVDCSLYDYDEFLSCFAKPADTELCKKYDFNDDGIVGGPDYPEFTKIQDQCTEEPGYCGDGIVNQDWEQCDEGLVSSQTCTAQCQDPNDEQCNDLTLAKITAANVSNSGSGDMDDEVFIGQSGFSIPQGVWFPLYWLGSYFVDGDISGYEDVPGFAVERQNGALRVVMHGSATAADIEHVDGTIELYNASVLSAFSDNDAGLGKPNKLENPYDTSSALDPKDDEVAIANASTVDYWFTTNTADDGVVVSYGIEKTCTQIACGNGIIENPETCDDGNTENGDGCSAQCTVEVPITSCGLYDLDAFLACYAQETDGEDECAMYDFNDDGIIGGPDYATLLGILNSCGELTVCKYIDVTGDGASEDDVPYGNGWNITIYPYDDSTTTPVFDGLTDENGCISLTELPDGNYLVIEGSLKGWSPTDVIGDFYGYIESIYDVLVSVSKSATTSITFFNYFDEGGNCADQTDNEEDGFTDADDRDCHTDGDVENEDSYDPYLTENDNHQSGDGTCSDEVNNDDDNDIDASDSDCHTDGDPDDGDDTYDPDSDETTEDVNEVVVTSGGGGGGGGGAPAGLNIHRENTTPDSPTEVTITWFTNLPATSRVVYDTVPHNPLADSGPNYGYAESTTEDATKVTFHSVTITGLTPNTTYYFRPVSTDNSATATGVQLTIAVTDDEIIVLGENTDTPGGVGGPEPEQMQKTGGSTGTGNGEGVENPEVLGLVAEADAQDEEGGELMMEDKDGEAMEEAMEEGPSCSGLWFFPALNSLPFPWCKWWPIVLLLVIVAIYYYMTRSKDEDGPKPHQQ